MCNFNQGFKLCTCPDKPVQALTQPRTAKADEPRTYAWTLRRYVGPSSGDIMGSYVPPARAIGAGLTAEFVLANLNAGNCFDFDYTPAEGDNLSIRLAEDYANRLEFIYRSGQWEAGHYSPFAVTTTMLQAGEVQARKPVQAS